MPHSSMASVAILVEYGRLPERDNLAFEWVDGTEQEVFLARAVEIAVCTAGEIRAMGFAAKAHWAGSADVDLDRLAVMAGVALRDGDTIVSPFVAGKFALAVVTTDYALETDTPLATQSLNSAKGFPAPSRASNARDETSARRI